jgi:hypothetical protein
MATATVISIMSFIQANSSDAMDAAARLNKWGTFIYVASIIVVAVATLLFTWTSNRLQDTVKADADAKIAAANAEAAKANEGLAKSNEEIARLTIEVADAKRRQAEAERALLELRERLKPRRLSNAQRTRLTDLLDKEPRGAVEIQCVRTPDNEPYTLAMDLVDVLMRSGWEILNVTSLVVLGCKIENLELRVPNKPPPHTIALERALNEIGFPTILAKNADPASESVVLFVGMKA